MPSQKGNERPQEYNYEEWQAGDPGDMPRLWHQDVLDREELRLALTESQQEVSIIRWKHSELLFEKKQLIPALQQLLVSCLRWAAPLSLPEVHIPGRSGCSGPSNSLPISSQRRQMTSSNMHAP